MTPLQREQYNQQTGADKNGKLQPVTIDFDGIEARLQRVTQSSTISDVTIAANGNYFIYATTENRLERIDITGNNRTVLAQSSGISSQLQYLSSLNEAIYKDECGKIFLTDLDKGATHQLSFSASLVIDRREEFLQVFDDILQLLKESFYEPTMHGIDLGKLSEQYLPRVQSAIEDADFQDIIREMLGELNASHLNIWSGQTLKDETGFLGFIPDYEDNSVGMKIRAIIPNTPAGSAAAKLKGDEKILAIDGEQIAAGQDYYQFLENTAGKELGIDLISREGINRSIGLVPIPAAKFFEAEYSDQVDKSRQLVDKLSDNKIAYFHFRQLDSRALESFEAEFPNITQTKTGLILDLRGNIGGSEHDRLLDFLSRKKYVVHRPRYGDEGSDAYGSFGGQMLLLVDEFTSSDAEIFAQGFRELKLGTIAGNTTYGAVIGTEQRLMIDGSTISIPTVGWYTLTGENLENLGVSPDVLITQDLSKLEKGEDSQLEESIKLLLQKLK
jgi:C-terminal processing protease CtpA/Prc